MDRFVVRGISANDSMTAVELMVAAQQWFAITRAMPTAKPSVKPAAAMADGPTIRKRGRPLGSRNKPKPPAAQATPTPTRKQARLVCNTSSSANNSSANNSSASNSSGDNSSSEDGSANNEEWVVSKLAAGVAGCKKSAVGVVEVLEPWRIDMVCKRLNCVQIASEPAKTCDDQGEPAKNADECVAGSAVDPPTASLVHCQFPLKKSSPPRKVLRLTICTTTATPGLRGPFDMRQQDMETLWILLAFINTLPHKRYRVACEMQVYDLMAIKLRGMHTPLNFVPETYNDMYKLLAQVDQAQLIELLQAFSRTRNTALAEVARQHTRMAWWAGSEARPMGYDVAARLDSGLKAVLLIQLLRAFASNNKKLLAEAGRQQGSAIQEAGLAAGDLDMHPDWSDASSPTATILLHQAGQPLAPPSAAAPGEADCSVEALGWPCDAAAGSEAAASLPPGKRPRRSSMAFVGSAPLGSSGQGTSTGRCPSAAAVCADTTASKTRNAPGLTPPGASQLVGAPGVSLGVYKGRARPAGRGWREADALWEQAEQEQEGGGGDGEAMLPSSSSSDTAEQDSEAQENNQGGRLLPDAGSNAWCADSSVWDPRRVEADVVGDAPSRQYTRAVEEAVEEEEEEEAVEEVEEEEAAVEEVEEEEEAVKEVEEEEEAVEEVEEEEEAVEEVEEEEAAVEGQLAMEPASWPPSLQASGQPAVSSFRQRLLQAEAAAPAVSTALRCTTAASWDDEEQQTGHGEQAPHHQHQPTWQLPGEQQEAAVACTTTWDKQPQVQQQVV
ncbi:hypothetical protein QJQ45_030278 [Haematococcus lacustris]|nr:hypothetical protein QJQ45_030278 [Haematococcus lacustris]